MRPIDVQVDARQSRRSGAAVVAGAHDRKIRR